MPATPHASLPYPTPDDPVSLGAADIRALAEALDPSVPRLVTPSEFAALTPVDKMEVRLLVDASTGIEWHLVYRAASAQPNKWEFLGGSPMAASIPTDEALINDTTWHNFPTGLTVTPPRSGYYEIYGQVRFYRGTAVRSAIGHGLGAAEPLSFGADQFGSDTATISYRQRQDLTSGVAVTLQYQFAAAPGTAFGARKVLAITPVLLS